MDSQYVPPTVQGHSSPLIQNSVPALMRNQTTPSESEIINLKSALKTTPQFVSCPFCRNQGMTRIEKNCSVANILCCVFSVSTVWLLLQACRGKDINCYNANHFCTRCGNSLSNYKAC